MSRAFGPLRAPLPLSLSLPLSLLRGAHASHSRGSVESAPGKDSLKTPCPFALSDSSPREPSLLVFCSCSAMALGLSDPSLCPLPPLCLPCSQQPSDRELLRGRMLRNSTCRMPTESSETQKHALASCFLSMARPEKFSRFPKIHASERSTL